MSHLPTHPRTRPATHRLARRTATVVLAVGLVALAACGDDAADSADTTSTTAVASSAPPTTAAPSGDDAHDHVEVTAVDFAFEGLPATIEAGTRLSLTNAAPHELHELVAFRLPDGEDRPIAELLKLPEEEVGKLLGAPATVLLAAPGEDQIPAVGDGTLTEPGRYIVMCAIPTGVDPAEYLKAAAAAGGQKPEVPGGPPHFVNGMVAELTVT